MEVKMMELIILPEIQQRLLPLRDEELRELERSVLEEGIRDPLVVWRKDGQLVLVDGHHRYELAKKYGLSFQVVEREFRDLDEVLIWVDRNQLGRRNLTDEQRAFIMHRLYGSVKLAPHRPSKEENALKLSAFSGRDATAKKIAQMTGVSAATVKRAHQFGKVVEALQEISQQAAERVLRGEVRDALTELPKVPEEAFSFVANSQTPPLFRGRAGGLAARRVI
jgi:ParB-like chromosome segregation protein Spo0J